MNVRLFTRNFCSWCLEAKEWLDAKGINYHLLDVGRDQAAYREMIELSNQPRVPVIEVDGQVLADFSPDELEAWWTAKGFGA